MNIPNVDFKKENLVISDLDVNDMQALHEAKNPQILINTLTSLDANPHIETVPITNNNAINELQSKIENIIISNEEWDNSKPPFDLDDEEDDITNEIMEEENKDNNTVINEVQPIEENNSYPKSYYITKEDFKKFVKALSILKSFKQNVVFDDGATYFYSDTAVYICKFDTNVRNISLKIPFADQQANQLSFLTKSKNPINIVETEDDYTFSDNQFKFQLRKNISDLNILNQERFNTILKAKTNDNVVAEYEFTDKNHLDNFLSIIKGVKRPIIEIKTSEDKTELVIDRGDINSGKFELLRMPCNIEILNGKKVDTILDSACLLYDYKTLKISFYYEGENTDSISVIIKGTIGDDYDVIFISTAYRDYTNRSIIF